jgi:DNA-binding Lrp family transcriptional regulator
LAFYTDDKKEFKTWAKLKEITKLSNGTLSKYIKELIEEEVVRGEVKVVNNRLETLYEYTQKGVRMTGKPYRFWKSGRPQKRLADERKRKKKIIGRIWKSVEKVS